MPFIDDLAVKPVSRSYYLNTEGTQEEVVPGVRRYILEAIISLDKVLADIERAGATILGEKSEFLKSLLNVVTYICGTMEGPRTSQNSTDCGLCEL